MALTKATMVGLGLTKGFAVSTLAALRNFEPRSDQDAVIVARAVEGGPLVNKVFYYDKDSTAVDDDFSVFVTPNGARWTYDTSDGYDVLLAGYSKTSNNLAQCINKMCRAFVSDVKVRGQVVDGSYKINIPTFKYNTRYIITETLRIPSFVEVHGLGSMRWAVQGDIRAVWIGNEFEGLNPNLGFADNKGAVDGGSSTQGYRCISCDGRITISGPGYSASTTSGILVGNVSTPRNTYLHVRDVVVSDINVVGFKSAWNWGYIDTYLCRAENFNFYRNLNGVEVDSVTFGNSGERLSFEHGIIGDHYGAQIYMNSRGHNQFFRDVSFDYASGDVVKFGPMNLGSVYISDSWIEGFQGYLCHNPERQTSDGQNYLQIANSHIIPLKQVGDAYAGVRQIGHAATPDDTVCEILDCTWHTPHPYVNSAYSAWKGRIGNHNRLILKIRYPLGGKTYMVLPSYDIGDGYVINHTLTFNGNEGENMPTSTSGNDFFRITSGGATVTWGNKSEADDDGYVPVRITLQNTSDVAQIFYGRRYYPPRSTQHIQACISVKCAGAVGQVNVQATARNMGRPTYVASGGTVQDNSVTGITVREQENLLGQSTSPTQNILNNLTKPGITLTANDYMGSYSMPLALSGCEYSYLGFRFTGFTGTIYVKLPAWWNPSLHPQKGFL